MKKLILTVILTAFTAVCSFSAVAGSDGSDKNKDAKSSQDKRDGDKYGKQPSSTSEIMKEQFPKDLSPEEKARYRDQEVMNKKPYKE